jgi:hypothetical protein
MAQLAAEESRNYGNQQNNRNSMPHNEGDVSTHVEVLGNSF